MLYNNIKFDNKCIFYMSTCCTSFENLGKFTILLVNNKNLHPELCYLKQNEISCAIMCSVYAENEILEFRNMVAEEL